MSAGDRVGPVSSVGVVQQVYMLSVCSFLLPFFNYILPRGGGRIKHTPCVRRAFGRAERERERGNKKQEKLHNERHKTTTKQRAYLDYSIPCRSGKAMQG